MLTGTQIEAANTSELEHLAERIENELECRQAQEEEDAARNVLESHDTPRGTYQWEMVLLWSLRALQEVSGRGETRSLPLSLRL